ncbi:MAG: response regulator transcription factor, partial [Chitinophagales bacterium]|nr:response regulator transcription factor [Chitinophagales bacterium]
GEMGKKMILQNNYDVVIMDIIIPYINGIELCKQIREVKPMLPILMLTALGTMEDKIAGFDAGADDYLLKPFEFAELLARIKALSKRNKGVNETSNTLQVGDLVLNLDKKHAVREGKIIELTAKELGLLEYLMRNKGRVVSRIAISEKVWDINFDTGTNVVEVYINILRKKIDKDFENKMIVTRIGLGYMLKED